MRNYSNPWAEKEKRKTMAKEHHEKMLLDHRHAIVNSVATVSIYEPFGLSSATKPYPADHMPEIAVVQSDSVSAAFEQDCVKVAILNFASYKNPGGMFMEGSIAQEEALCHESTLYEILSHPRIVSEFYEKNRRYLVKGLYMDRVLYVPNVFFEHNGMQRYFDVITCAAPNKGTAQKYQNVPDDVCDKAMRDRIRAVLNAAELERVDVLILGAFGCGVFKNDPATVAQMFKEELHGHRFKAVFAVPGDKYHVFAKVFGEEGDSL